MRSARIYAEGVLDGFETTLSLLLGIPQEGGEPFKGELPDDVRNWAEQGLEATKMLKEALTDRGKVT